MSRTFEENERSSAADHGGLFQSAQPAWGGDQVAIDGTLSMLPQVDQLNREIIEFNEKIHEQDETIYEQGLSIKTLRKQVTELEKYISCVNNHTALSPALIGSIKQHGPHDRTCLYFTEKQEGDGSKGTTSG